MGEKGLLMYTNSEGEYHDMQVAASGGKWLKSSVMAIVLAVSVRGASAQGENPLPWDGMTEPAAYVTFDVQDTEWSLYPIITADDTFMGFFGYMPDEFVVGNNVSLLWLTPDNGDGTWSMYGWSHTDLKVVSQYLDNLTGTTNVLADTGLDIFAGEAQPITQPQNMPFGIVEDDPAAPIVAATQDPAIAEALISVGAAGAPNLTGAMNLQPIGFCDNIAVHAGVEFSQLDFDLAYRARIVQETMEIWLSDGVFDSLSATGLDQDESVLRGCCTPMDNMIWGAWTPWDCAVGPFQNGGGGQCTYEGCSRSRTGWHVVITSNCTFSRIPISQSPSNETVVIPSVNGECPPSP